MNYFIGADTPIAVANRHLAHGVFTYKGVVCPFAPKVVLCACCQSLRK